ncbi:MAG: type II toxin-antitoxin system HicB family antitoxin [Ardenticatenaceae bacterium]|nr:type II toxin-antitoxin system HicB family antitoxin [Ardenticatenaceae bacterium]HBY99016.1 toxin-antitoxin system HicB family antitoxin [Chloroflexota bacterium]
MSRLTLRLPDTLHEQLQMLAKRENISLNQYIVYALTRQATWSYTVQALPEKAIAEQRAAYTALLQSLGQATFDEIQKVMAEREPAERDNGLTPETVERLQKRLTDRLSTA